MGLWQRFINYMWLTGCDVWLSDCEPRYHAPAKALCVTFREYLLECKAAGKTPQEASCELSILILTGLSEGVGSGDSEVAAYQKVAYNGAYACLNQWPRVDLGNDYIVRLFMVMAKLDGRIWQSPLAKNMGSLLDSHLSILDSRYISECVGQLSAMSPNNSQHAEQFCTENAQLLLENRDEGFSVDMSVGFACVMLLDSPAKKMESSTGLAGLTLIIARDYAMASIARWPSSGVSSLYKEALENFSKYMETQAA